MSRVTYSGPEAPGLYDDAPHRTPGRARARSCTCAECTGHADFDPRHRYAVSGRPLGKYDAEPAPALVALFKRFAPALALCIALLRCGGSRTDTATGRASRVAAFVDPTYAFAVEACDAAEGVVYSRHEPEEAAAAYAALEDVRRRCDHIFRTALATRAAVAAAHVAIEAAEDGRITLAEALGAIDEAEDLGRRVRDLVRAFVAQNPEVAP